MSIGFSNAVTKQKGILEGKLQTQADKKSAEIKNAKASYQEKYGNASIFDVANSQRNINTQAGLAQTPNQQNQVATASQDALINGLLKLQTVINNITDKFENLMNTLKDTIIRLATVEAGQQPSNPNQFTGTTGSNNQGSENNTRLTNQTRQLPQAGNSEVVDKQTNNQNPNNQVINENEAQKSSQIDKKKMEEIIADHEQQFFENNVKELDDAIPDIEKILAGAGAGSTAT